MKTKSLKIIFTSALLGMGTAISSNAAFIFGGGDYPFANSGQFDGDGVSDTAGPFVDSATDVVFTLTTTAITGDGVNTLNENSGTVAPGSTDTWAAGDTWTFTSDRNLLFQGIDFSGIGAGESIDISSPAWASLTPGALGAGVSFSAGTFTLSNGNTNDDFSLADLGGIDLIVPIGQSITFGNVVGNVGDLQDFTVTALASAPEPSTLGLLLIGCIAMNTARQKRKA